MKLALKTALWWTSVPFFFGGGRHFNKYEFLVFYWDVGQQHPELPAASTMTFLQDLSLPSGCPSLQRSCNAHDFLSQAVALELLKCSGCHHSTPQLGAKYTSN